MNRMLKCFPLFLFFHAPVSASQLNVCILPIVKSFKVMYIVHSRKHIYWKTQVCRQIKFNIRTIQAVMCNFHPSCEWMRINTETRVGRQLWKGVSPVECTWIQQNPAKISNDYNFTNSPRCNRADFISFLK